MTLDYIFFYCYKCLKMIRRENTLFEEGSMGRGDGDALTWANRALSQQEIEKWNNRSVRLRA